MITEITINSLVNFSPEILLFLMAMIILMAGIYKFSEKYVFHLVVFSTIFAFFLGFQNYSSESILIFNESIIKSEVTDLFKFLCYFLFLIQILVSRNYLKNKNLISGEFYSLLVFALIGCLIIISSNNLIVLFLGIKSISFFLARILDPDRTGNGKRTWFKP